VGALETRPAISALTCVQLTFSELRNVIERAMAFPPTPTVLRAEHLRID
jgi:hypothetical protein